MKGTSGNLIWRKICAYAFIYYGGSTIFGRKAYAIVLLLSIPNICILFEIGVLLFYDLIG